MTAGMTAPSGGSAPGGRGSRVALLVIFGVALIPVVVLVLAWLRGDRTDISLDLPPACQAVDAEALQVMAPGGVPVAHRSVGTSSATDTCAVATTGHTLDVSVAADPQRFDAGYRSATCATIHAAPATSGSDVSCTASDAETSPSRIDQYLWVAGVYEVRLTYRLGSGTLLSGAMADQADRIVRTLVDGLPTH